MPKITPDQKLKKHFMAKLQEKCAPVRTEIHASDLVNCLRKAFFRRMENRQLTLQDLLFFLDRHQRHAGLQGLVNDLHPEQQITRWGVVGHPDLASDRPIEIKTSAGQVMNGNGKPAHILRQCAYYCLLQGVTSCNLIMQYIKQQQITFELVEFTPQELAQYKDELLERRALLQQAFVEQDPSLLPDVKDHQCDQCEFADKCDELARAN